MVGEPGSGRTKAQLEAAAQTRSFADDVQVNMGAVERALSRGTDAAAAGADPATVSMETAKSDIMRRALFVMGSGLEVDRDVSGRQNGLPVGAELPQGCRTVVEIPAGSGDRFLNWMMTGDAARDHSETVSKKDRGTRAAADGGRPVYTRSAATHDTGVRGGQVYEKKLNLFQALRSSGHMGMDVALAGYDEPNPRDPSETMRSDGSAGHFYMKYNPPTADRPGSFMFGIEGTRPPNGVGVAPPTFELSVSGVYGGHNILGSTDHVTPAGTRPSREEATRLRAEQALCGVEGVEHPFGQTRVGERYDARTVRLDADGLEAVCATRTAEIPNSVARMAPADSPAAFRESMRAERPPEVTVDRAKAAKAAEVCTAPKVEVFEKAVKAADKAFKKDEKAHAAKVKALESAAKGSSGFLGFFKKEPLPAAEVEARRAELEAQKPKKYEAGTNKLTAEYQGQVKEEVKKAAEKDMYPPQPGAFRRMFGAKAAEPVPDEQLRQKYPEAIVVDVALDRGETLENLAGRGFTPEHLIKAGLDRDMTPAELEGKGFAAEKVRDVCVTSIEQLLEMDSSPGKLAELREKYPGAMVDEALHRLEDEDPELPRDDRREPEGPEVATPDPLLRDTPELSRAERVARMIENEDVQRGAEASREADTAAGLGIQGAFSAVEAAVDALDGPDPEGPDRRDSVSPALDAVADRDPDIKEKVADAGMDRGGDDGVAAPAAGRSAEHAAEQAEKAREGGGPAAGM